MLFYSTVRGKGCAGVRLHLSTEVREFHFFHEDADVNPDYQVVVVFSVDTGFSPHAVHMPLVVDCSIHVEMEGYIGVSTVDLRHDSSLGFKFTAVGHALANVFGDMHRPVFVREVVNIDAVVETSTLIRMSGFKHHILKTSMVSGFLDNRVNAFLTLFNVF